MPKRKTPKPPTTLSPGKVALAVKLAKKGHGWSEIGRKIGAGRDAVKRAVMAVDPSLGIWTVDNSNGDGTRHCVVCERKLPEKGKVRRYCPTKTRDCRKAVRTLREVTVWRPRHNQTVAKAEGRKVRRVNAADLTRTQILHRQTKAFKLLEKHGLVELLPSYIEIR